MAKPRAKKQVGPFLQFRPWFKAQFGRDILDTKTKYALEREATAAQLTALKLERLSREEDRFDDVHDAALKGWVAGYEAAKAELGLTELSGPRNAAEKKVVEKDQQRFAVHVCDKCLPEEVEELTIGTFFKTRCIVCDEYKDPSGMKCVRALPERLEKELIHQGKMIKVQVTVGKP